MCLGSGSLEAALIATSGKSILFTKLFGIFTRIRFVADSWAKRRSGSGRARDFGREMTPFGLKWIRWNSSKHGRHGRGTQRTEACAERWNDVGTPARNFTEAMPARGPHTIRGARGVYAHHVGVGERCADWGIAGGIGRQGEHG